MRVTRFLLLVFSIVLLLDHLPRGIGSGRGRRQRRQRTHDILEVPTYLTFNAACEALCQGNTTVNDIHEYARNGAIFIRDPDYAPPRSLHVGRAGPSGIRRSRSNISGSGGESGGGSGSGSGRGSGGGSRSGSGSGGGNRGWSGSGSGNGGIGSPAAVSGESGDEALTDLSQDIYEPGTRPIYNDSRDAFQRLSRHRNPAWESVERAVAEQRIVTRSGAEAYAREQSDLTMQRSLGRLRISHDDDESANVPSSARLPDNRDARYYRARGGRRGGRRGDLGY